ncbi:MAG TPA: molybdate ABC transporter permease subunit [Thermoanaerobaculia bacterium]|nr:molybdate ABC transporter permease subunit [Thermoanaerobaculia bacterium]
MSDLPILLFTLKIGLFSTLLVFPLALALAAVIRFLPAGPRVAVEVFGSLPLVLPPTAVGLLLLEMLSRDTPAGAFILNRGIEVLFTPTAVVVATSVMSFPLMFRSFRVAIDSVDPRYYGVARTLGAGPAGAFFRVVLPLSWRGLAAGVLLGWTRAIGEFGATVMVAGNIPGRTQTLALAIYQRVQSGREETAIPLVLFAVILALIAVAGSEWLSWTQTRRSR